MGQDLDPDLVAEIQRQLDTMPTAAEAEEAAAAEFIRLEDLERWEDPAQMFDVAGVHPEDAIRRLVKSLEKERASTNLWRMLAAVFGVGMVVAIIMAALRRPS